MNLKKYMTCRRRYGIKDVLLCATLIFACSTKQLRAEPLVQTVEQIKTAYIYNFAKFIDLPSAIDDKLLRVCLVGKDDLGGALHALNHRIAQGKEVVVRKDVRIDQLNVCAVVFVGRADLRWLSSVGRQLDALPVLVISDAINAVDLGAHLGLVVSEDRVGFDVNLPLLQKSGIKASSQMLNLARTIVR